VRRAASTGLDREKKKNSSGILTVKMPSKITQSNDDPNVKFMEMCEIGDESGLKVALKSKEQQIRMEDDRGEMPIHKLARQGCVEPMREMMDRLVKAEAIKTDLNWQDKQGKTPIFYAVEYGHERLVQLFLDRGSDVMVENHNGWTILHSAVNADRLSVVELILTHPCVVPERKKLLSHSDKSRRTALHIASFKSAEGDMVSLLLKYGADPQAKDASGNTGATLAGKTGRRKSKELLEEHIAAAVGA
jgi:ankyrin repeat protein